MPDNPTDIVEPKPNAWIVVGSTGEYSDFIQWNVIAYTDEPAAAEHAKRANDFEATVPKKDGWPCDETRNPHDPQSGGRDYTGTSYEVVPLVVHGLDVPTADEIARLRGEVEDLKALLWIGWREMNAIRAETGVPIGANGLRKGIDEHYWSESVEKMAEALGDLAAPWPPKARETKGDPQ